VLKLLGRVQQTALLTNFSLDTALVLGIWLLGMSQQTAFLTHFSLVLGTWYSAFGKATANCALDQLQPGP
jgi:hypothetical protein